MQKRSVKHLQTKKAGLVILFVAVAAMVFTAALHSQLAYYYYR